jgi:hypothetical protein
MSFLVNLSQNAKNRSNRHSLLRLSS